MATSDTLVSCVIDFDERLQLLITSTSTNVFFFTKANLYYYTNFLLTKHVDAFESKSA
jgi:hypothetical protein